MSLALVHLVWGPAGPAPFDRFLEAYRSVPTGAEHELVMLYNGFDSPGELAPFRQRAGSAREVVLEGARLDLQAYRAAATELGHDRLCFVNSYSRPQSPGWLKTLTAPLDDPNVGATGASGSWGSHLSYNLFHLGLRNTYGEAFPDRAATRAAMRDIVGGPGERPVRDWLYALWITLRHRRASARFPSPHLRTNAFAIDRRRFLDTTSVPLETKWDTYRLESGPFSLTSRLRAAGTPPLVVDRHGSTFAVADWPSANVFCQDHQQDLLVADNQTDFYANAASLVQRQVLSASAWGPRARPAWP